MKQVILEHTATEVQEIILVQAVVVVNLPIDMGKRSNFSKSRTLEIQILKLAGCLQK